MAFLLLVQLDGRVACASLSTGALRWRAALPGGPLARCGRRRGDRLWALRGPPAGCAACAGLCGDCAEPLAALAGAGAGGGEAGGEAACLLVARGAAPGEWITAAGVPVEDAVRRWNAHTCAAHRAVSLRRVDASLTEMDLRTGRVLSFVSGDSEDRGEDSEKDNGGDDEEVMEEAVSPLRLVARRTDVMHRVLLPIGEGSWYATFATVELDVLHVPQTKDTANKAYDGTESEMSGFVDTWSSEIVHSLTFVEQSIMPNGEAKVHLHTNTGNVTLQISEPAVRAFVFTAPGVSPVVNIHEISIRSAGVGGTAQRLCVTPTDVPLHGALISSKKERISGIFHSKRGVLFADSLPSTPLSDVGGRGVEGCISEAMDLDSEREEEKTEKFNDTEGEQGNTGRILSSPSSAPALNENVSMALLPHSHNIGETRSGENALMTTHGGDSFFDENFEVVSLLGRGASGAVVLARHNITGIFYAVKIILTQDYFTKEAALREVRLHAMLRNPCLVRYYACWSEAVTARRLEQLASVGLCSAKEVRSMKSFIGQEHFESSTRVSEWSRYRPLALPSGQSGYLEGHDENGSDGTSWDGSSSSSTASISTPMNFHSPRVVFLQLEYCQTTLAERLGSRRCIDRIENIIIALHIFRGLQYLHDNGCLHRDVKPTNVFLDYRQQLSTIDCDDGDDDDDDDDESVHFNAKWAKGIQVQRKGWTSISEEVMHPDAVASLVHPTTATAFDLLQMNPRFLSLGHQLHKHKKYTTLTKKMRKEVRSMQKWLRRRYVQVRIGDFGLSKLVSEQRVDVSGYFHRCAINTIGVGSPIYSSPEQLEGNVCTASSDAFSCGILFAEMYLQPKTVAERLVELRRAREGFFLEETMLKAYPELRIVHGLTQRDPQSRISLADATQVLSDVLDDTISSFFLREDE